MEISEKVELNKKIRSYNGENSFILSIQKQLKTSKYLKKEEFGKKMVKVLSDRQYEAVISILG
jgi:predicted transcriptional regulator with HTH domain